MLKRTSSIARARCSGEGPRSLHLPAESRAGISVATLTRRLAVDVFLKSSRMEARVKNSKAPRPLKNEIDLRPQFPRTNTPR